MATLFFTRRNCTRLNSFSRFVVIVCQRTLKVTIAENEFLIRE